MTNKRNVRRSDFLSGVILLTSRTASRANAANIPADFANLERSSGGRLGVFALDTGSGMTLAYRAHERFPMCSTFKLLLAAAVLHRVEHGIENLGRHVAYTEANLLPHSQFTTQHVHDGFMTVEDLCMAAVEYSDNCAANLLLASIGGPSAVTSYARSLGDSVTRLDRIEMALNSAIPGDPRDTTSPAAMAADLQRVVLETVLGAGSRQHLAGWLKNCKTGTSRLRAGLPKTWVVGDKMGTGGANNAHGDSNTGNDIAIAWPPGRAPVIVTAYLTECALPGGGRDAVLASVGRIVGEHFNR